MGSIIYKNKVGKYMKAVDLRLKFNDLGLKKRLRRYDPGKVSGYYIKSEKLKF